MFSRLTFQQRVESRPESVKGKIIYERRGNGLLQNRHVHEMSCFAVALATSQAELRPRLALLSRKGTVSETSSPWTDGRSSIQQRKGTWFPTAVNRMTKSWR